MNHRYNENSLVSVGMPIYNGAEYLAEAINSILAQSYPFFELIISDNASIDKTRDICEYYAAKDNRIKYFRQSMNRGAVYNFEFVLQQSEGVYFMWAAYDDLWSSNFIEECFQFLHGHPEIDFIFPNFILKSIQFSFFKKIEDDIYTFISSDDRRFRVLNFLILHQYSHKCNIVYSFFRKNFILAALEKQDISNDGNLGLVILSNGRGYFYRKIKFYKRYRKIWPGLFRGIIAFFSAKTTPEFENSKMIAKKEIIAIMPEYYKEVEFVFQKFTIHNNHIKYKICEYEEL